MAKKLTRKEVDVLEEINALRAEKKLKPLTVNKALELSATAHAKYVYESKHWAHDTKDGKKFTTWMTNRNDYLLVGENIARKFKDKKRMIAAWNKSPSHQKNILNDYHETGIGTYGNVTVQLFGQKKK